MLESAGTLISQRALQWDLSVIEPGLMLRVGPTSDANSMLEFVMDPNQDRGDRYLVDEPSTGTVKLSFSNFIKEPSRINVQKKCHFYSTYLLHVTQL